MQPKRAISILNFPNSALCFLKRFGGCCHSFLKFIHLFHFYSSISIRRGLSPFHHHLLLRGKNLHWVPSRDSTSGLPSDQRCTIVEAVNWESEYFTQDFTSEDLVRHKYLDWLQRVTFSLPSPCSVPSLTLYFTSLSSSTPYCTPPPPQSFAADNFYS